MQNKYIQPENKEEHEEQQQNNNVAHLLQQNQTLRQEVDNLKHELQVLSNKNKQEIKNMRADTHNHLSYMAEVMKQLQESQNTQMQIMYSQMRDQRLYYEDLITKVTKKISIFLNQQSESKQDSSPQSLQKLKDPEIQKLKTQLQDLKQELDNAQKYIETADEHQQEQKQYLLDKYKQKDINTSYNKESQSLNQLSQFYDSYSQQGSSPITSPHLSTSRILKNIQQSKNTVIKRENEIKQLEKNNFKPYQDQVKEGLAAANYSKNTEQYKQKYFTEQLMKIEGDQNGQK